MTACKLAAQSCRLDYCRTKYRHDPEFRSTARNHHILRKYGLTPEEYQKLWDDQRGCCFTCGGPLVAGKGAHVDHDHYTGKVRALLCNGCNCALGWAKENPQTLRNLAIYAAGARVDRERAGG